MDCTPIVTKPKQTGPRYGILLQVQENLAQLADINIRDIHIPIAKQPLMTQPTRKVCNMK